MKFVWKESMLGTIWTRSKQLVAKLISVKGMFALSSSYAFFKESTIITVIAFIASWGLFIGAREYEKLKEILPKWQGNC